MGRCAAPIWGEEACQGMQRKQRWTHAWSVGCGSHGSVPKNGAELSSNFGGGAVEARWKHGGSVVEDGTFLVEAGSEGGLAPYVSVYFTV